MSFLWNWQTMPSADICLSLDLLQSWNYHQLGMCMPFYNRLLQSYLHDPVVETFKDMLLLILVFYSLLSVFGFLWKQGPLGCVRIAKDHVVRGTFALIKALPGAKGKIQKELDKVVHEIEGKLASDKERQLVKHRSLPFAGLSDKEVMTLVDDLQKLETIDWRNGRVSGTVYHGGKEMSQLLSQVYAQFSHTNPLHPDVFPSIRRMEAEVISMCLRMYHADDDQGCGSVTSGGTESILMACKAYRDRGRMDRGITEPEIVVPVSVHAAFDKAAAYFGIKIIHAPLDPNTYRVDVRAVKRLITSNTVMIAGSAPAYPHGTIDDIEALAKLAKRYRVGLHVDCCLGSFIVPFLEQAGFPSRLFDFRVDGVTSISCDTHKFGFAPKGSSVVMYSTKELRQYQYFVAPNWPGGIYASPSIAGSRPGALIAACWAALMKTGENGYVEATRKIVGAAREIADVIREMDGIELCGEPDAMVVAFQSKTLNVYAVSDEMTKLGWNLNALQYPPAVHICCTLPTTVAVGQFITDLKEAVQKVKANPNIGKEGMGAIYGMAASIPDKSLVSQIAKGYLDALTKL